MTSLTRIIEESSEESSEEWIPEKMMDTREEEGGIEMRHFERSQSMSTIHEQLYEETNVDIHVHSEPNLSAINVQEHLNTPLWVIHNQRALARQMSAQQMEGGNPHTPAWIIPNPYVSHDNLHHHQGSGPEEEIIQIEEMNPNQPNWHNCMMHNPMYLASSSSSEHQMCDKPDYDDIGAPPLAPPFYQMDFRPRFLPQLEYIRDQMDKNFKIIMAMFIFFIFMGSGLLGFIIYIIFNGALRRK